MLECIAHLYIRQANVAWKMEVQMEKKQLFYETCKFLMLKFREQTMFSESFIFSKRKRSNTDKIFYKLCTILIFLLAIFHVFARYTTYWKFEKNHTHRFCVHIVNNFVLRKIHKSPIEQDTPILYFARYSNIENLKNSLKLFCLNSQNFFNFI